MISLTKKEREILLLIFKDFNNFYNANSISKVVKISHVGAQKVFKRLLKENIIISKTIGKSIIYKLNFNSDYANQLMIFLLADEANKFTRWKEEFKELFKENRIIVLFGSTVKNYANARDIDIMTVIEEKEINEIHNVISKKQKILPKKIHNVILTHDDLPNNLKNRNEAMIDIVKNGIVLYGQYKYVEVIKNVTTF